MKLRMNHWIWIISVLFITIGVSGVPSGAVSLHVTRLVGCGAGSYANIQTAVNAASTNDTIKVCKGKYFENVNVTVDGLRIVGGGVAQLECPGKAGVGFDLNAYEISVEEFSVGDCDTGIAVEPHSGGNSIISDNIHDNGVGLALNSSNGLNTVTNCDINKNRADGIFDYGAFFDTFTDLSVHNNAGNGVEISTNIAFVRIANSVIQNNGADGVYLQHSQFMLVSGNTLSQNGNDGLELNAAYQAYIFGNDLDQNKHTGGEAHSSTTSSTFDNNRAVSNNVFNFSDADGNNWFENSCPAGTTGGSATCI
jgi:parallel beta-helix repeat protein